MTFCIPAAGSVPGYSGQPPYWLPGHPTYPQDTGLDDPRWRGAYRRRFNAEAEFRALYHVEGGTRVLYLSWTALYVQELDDADDILWVGFQPGAGGTAMVIRIQVHPSPVTHTADPVGPIDVYTNAAAPWPSVTEPTWINDNTRMWVTPGLGTSGSWTVQMRVPLPASGSLTDNAGPNLGNTFKLWFVLRGGTGTGPVKLVEFPTTLSTNALALNTSNYPAPSGWEGASTVPGDPACPTSGGIDFEWLDVGTTNPIASQIKYEPSTDPNVPKPTNTFFARPRNYTGANILAMTLEARFRIAMWGSVVAPAAWTDVPGGGSVKNAVDIPAITPGTTPPATNPISFPWTLTNAEITTYTTGTPHRCMLVELKGPYTFFHDSVYRNMDFVPASTFRRDAEISLVGLEPVTGGGPRRDVYLAIETLNMPAHVPPPEPHPPQRDSTYEHANENVQYGQQGGPRPIDLARAGDLSQAEIDASVPTYRVHVYHDTGERVMQGGVSRPVLEPQTHFGYYVDHAGPLVGWRHQLQAPPAAQLHKIADDFYRISVPNNGVQKVTTVIQAVEPGDDGHEGCLMGLPARLGAFLKRLFGG